MSERDPHTGQFVLDQLQRFGSHLDRTHEVTFWLYFPSEEASQGAAARARHAGLHPEVSPPLSDEPDRLWLCLLSLPHIPDETILDGIFDFCEQLALAFDGKFDGWESSIELDEEELQQGLSGGYSGQ